MALDVEKPRAESVDDRGPGLCRTTPVNFASLGLVGCERANKS